MGRDYLPGRELTMSLLPQFTLPNGEQVKNLISILQEELVDFFSQDQLGNQIVTLNSIGMKEGKKISFSLMGKLRHQSITREKKQLRFLRVLSANLKNLLIKVFPRN